jgi:hypothetical protein
MTPEEIAAHYAARERVARETLAVELALPRYDSMTQQQAYDDLHATSKTESVTQLAELTLVGLLGDLSSESKGKVCDWVHLLDFRAKVLQQDRQGVAIYIDLLVNAGKISPAEAQAAMGQLQATETVEVTTAVIPRIATDFGGIANFPNKVKPETFALAWADAGRK